jgi:hypothetical protein
MGNKGTVHSVKRKSVNIRPWTSDVLNAACLVSQCLEKVKPFEFQRNCFGIFKLTLFRTRSRSRDPNLDLERQKYACVSPEFT